MALLADDAGPDMRQLLEMEGFQQYHTSKENIAVMVNRDVSPHPIPIRLDSPMTEGQARSLLYKAGVPTERINRFIERHLRQE